MKLMTKAIEKLFVKIGDQSNVKDPTIVCKFFNPIGSATWYATEYTPKDKVFFGYVTRMTNDEWGYFSLNEMQEIKLKFGLGIERDLYFKSKKFSDVNFVNRM